MVPGAGVEPALRLSSLVSETKLYSNSSNPAKLNGGCDRYCPDDTWGFKPVLYYLSYTAM